MFFNCSKSEGRDFLSQSEPYFIPGYTGHCPTLKFHFGKCYGACTREIIQAFSTNGVIRNSVKNVERNRPTRSLPTYPNICHHKYILGYTGYIPGMYHYHGLSFHQIAEKCERKRLNRKISFCKKYNSSNSKT